MKTCPYCAEPIEDAAIVCRYCGSNVNEPPVRAPAYDARDDFAMRLLTPVGCSAWAIVAGYLGLFSLLIFPAPLALFVSVIAINRVRNDPTVRGMGRAVFGLIMGLIGTGVLIFAIVAPLFQF